MFTSVYRTIILTLGLVVISCQPDNPKIDLPGEQFSVKGSPIWLDENTLSENKATHLKNIETGQLLPLQKDGEKRVFLNDQSMKSEGVKSYELIVSDELSDNQVIVKEENEELSVHVAGKPVLVYHTGIVEPQEGLPAYYRRSGFIHPLYSPSGEAITDGMPKGHTHQHGIFFAWTQTAFQDQNPEFWNQHKEAGTVSHVEVLDKSSGPVYGEFRVKHHFLAIQEKDTTTVLEEIWTVRVYANPSPYIIDLISEQTTVTDSPLHILKYHYGGMAFRGSGEWNDLEFKQPKDNPQNAIGPGQGGFLTAEGKTRIDGNHTRPEWVAMYGKVNSKPVGLAALDHPDNFRYPQYVRLHPSMPYFCFSPMVDEPFDIKPGETYRSQYRIISFDGSPDANTIGQYGTFH